MRGEQTVLAVSSTVPVVQIGKNYVLKYFDFRPVFNQIESKGLLTLDMSLFNRRSLF